jgi:hypothetical protein
LFISLISSIDFIDTVAPPLDVEVPGRKISQCHFCESN